MSLDKPTGSTHTPEELKVMRFDTQLDAVAFFEENGLVNLVVSPDTIFLQSSHAVLVAVKDQSGAFKLTDEGIEVLSVPPQDHHYNPGWTIHLTCQ